MNPNTIIMHHSLTKDSETVSWGAIRDYHLKKGWDDVGYHFGIELVGKHYEILVGRTLDKDGAHCRGYNSDTIGICLVGDFDKDLIPQKQWKMALKLVTSLCKQFDIPAKRVHTHRYFNRNKSCPGSNFDLGLFRLQLRELADA